MSTASATSPAEPTGPSDPPVIGVRADWSPSLVVAPHASRTRSTVGAQTLWVVGKTHDTDSQASARIARAVSACSIVTTSGGAMRIARSPHVSTSSPRSKHALLERLGGVVVGRVDADHQTAAANVGDHRLLRAAHGGRRGGGCPRSPRWRPARLRRGRAWRPPRRTRPGCHRTSSRAPGGQSMMSALAISADSGSPLARPLPAQITSGTTPSCSHAHIVPVRPMPLCTSSITSRIP